ncbi:MAG: DUF4870 domain-containing protein [Candidatus Diapherotrites archaeon]
MEMELTKDGKIKDSKTGAGGKGSDESKLIAAIAYLGVLLTNVTLVLIIIPILTLLLKGEDKFVKFHSIQAIGLIVAEIVIGIILFIIAIPVVLLTLGLGLIIVAPVFIIVWLFFIIAPIYLAYKAYQGEMYKLPYIGDFAEKHAK